jgi:hypothetical protein
MNAPSAHGLAVASGLTSCGWRGTKINISTATKPKPGGNLLYFDVRPAIFALLHLILGFYGQEATRLEDTCRFAHTLGVKAHIIGVQHAVCGFGITVAGGAIDWRVAMRRISTSKDASAYGRWRKSAFWPIFCNRIAIRLAFASKCPR